MPQTSNAALLKSRIRTVRDWLDQPEDRPPFGRGLVRVDGSTAREHTDLLSEINLGAARRRALHP